MLAYAKITKDAGVMSDTNMFKFPLPPTPLGVKNYLLKKMSDTNMLRNATLRKNMGMLKDTNVLGDTDMV